MELHQSSHLIRVRRLRLAHRAAFPLGQAEVPGCAPQMLPEVVPSAYGGMTIDTYAALEGAPPAGDLKRVRRYIVEQYAAIPDPERALGGASEAEFAWALSVRPGILCMIISGICTAKRTLVPSVPAFDCTRAVGAAMIAMIMCVDNSLCR